MPNVSREELMETKAQKLPETASLESLKQMREEMCSTTMSRDFKLQPNQRFIRRVLSPDSPTRNLLLVHGTGVGKTCTAIQVAEEYIIRPEFQDKRVLVIANPSVQENFKTQIFDITRVSVDADGILLSKQCTGRKYLDIIQRSQKEPLLYTDKASKQRIVKLSEKLINEFYEFSGYKTLANVIQEKKLNVSPNEFDTWMHETFDNRLMIIDEAHNLKETTETETNKLISLAIEDIIKKADGITLVLLTATPMYDSFDEILYYITLFLWNDRRIDFKKQIKSSDIFKESGEFKEGQEEIFRGWCQDYISFVRGENPFTFPFRLPPPNNLIALPDRKTSIDGLPITKKMKYLVLTQSILQSPQKEEIQKIKQISISSPLTSTICVYPENKTFRETFVSSGTSYKYRSEMFLKPSEIHKYSSKFSLITKILSETTGLVFVYSNSVESGAQLFAMCLEEHGYESADGSKLLEKTSEEITPGSKGKYVLFTSNTTDSIIKKMLMRLKSQQNADGSDIRVIIASPKVSEGVDFRFIRQIHILDPWYNMSRIEQVIGRGMRTCSHALLDFKEQNCTVYLHICRYDDSSVETVDEFIYRKFVEDKAIKISKVKKVIMESAMDCELQESVNSLPPQWRGEKNESGEQFTIPQHRNQDPPNVILNLPLMDMTAPTFDDSGYSLKCVSKPQEVEEHYERPLSAILDVKDEILYKISKLFLSKPIWKKDDLFKHSSLKQYTPKTLSYILQNAIDSRFQLKDKFGRDGYLQSKNKLFSFVTNDSDTLVDRVVSQENASEIDLNAEPVVEEVVHVTTENKKLDEYEFPPFLKDKFEKSVYDWYIVDSVFTVKEKLDHLLELDWTSPPIYAAPLITTTSEGKKLFILGDKQIYNEEKQKITPIGIDLDAYNAWVKTAKDKFIQKKNDFFAWPKPDTGITFSIGDSTTISRAPRSKTFSGKACNSYKKEVTEAFSEWLGEPFPPEVKTKVDRCLYLELLVRKSVLIKKDGIFWVTPEEMSIFMNDDNRPDVLKALKD